MQVKKVGRLDEFHIILDLFLDFRGILCSGLTLFFLPFGDSSPVGCSFYDGFVGLPVWLEVFGGGGSTAIKACSVPEHHTGDGDRPEGTPVTVAP